MKSFFTKVQRKLVIYPLMVLLLFGGITFTSKILFDQYHLKTDAISNYLSKNDAEKYYLTIANANLLSVQIVEIKGELKGLNEGVTRLNSNFETLLKIALDTNRKLVRRDQSTDTRFVNIFDRGIDYDF